MWHLAIDCFYFVLEKMSDRIKILLSFKKLKSFSLFETDIASHFLSKSMICLALVSFLIIHTYRWYNGHFTSQVITNSDRLPPPPLTLAGVTLGTKENSKFKCRLNRNSSQLANCLITTANICIYPTIMNCIVSFCIMRYHHDEQCNVSKKKGAIPDPQWEHKGASQSKMAVF